MHRSEGNTRTRRIKCRVLAGVMALFIVCSLISAVQAVHSDGRKGNRDYGSQDQNPAARGMEVDIKGLGKVQISDLMLRDQKGKKVRFYTDLIKDKVVVMSFFYTSCTYTCTLQGRTFSKLQSLLGNRLGKSVFLISVTSDPARDNPGQLNAWAQRYDVRSGWTLVTGEVAEMNKLLIPFIGTPAGGGMHLPVTFIGNDKTGVWSSAEGVFAPEDLLKAIDYLTRDDTGSAR